MVGFTLEFLWSNLNMTLCKFKSNLMTEYCLFTLHKYDYKLSMCK